jgi:hypothetical protein
LLQPHSRFLLMAHFRHAYTANKCLLMSNKQTTTAGNYPAPKSILDTRNDELERDGCSLNRLRIDRDRGEPRSSAPPTPPCIRVRTRRFEKLR